MSQFNWDDMQYFLALARHGQLTGAARHLGASHVTVARRIDRLEAALHQRLFERSARGYALTASGRRMVEAAERMEEASGGVQPGQSVGQGLSGTLRLAVPEGFSAFFSQTILPRFIDRFPSLSLDLITMTQVLSLSRREADLTVTLGQVGRGAYLSEHLADYRLRIYAARDYLDRHPVIRSRDDLPAHRFLGYIEDMLFAPGLDYLNEVHPALRPVFKSSSIFNQLTAVQQGLGLCVLPCYLARRDAGLVPVLPANISLVRSYWLTCHADTRQTRRERTVISFLAGEMAQAAAILAPGEADPP
ncbi:LysR family transcriptional regulator [Fertoebacter nigrum]|uniref:LysR family transcriptional regulator n=1 Tax=Fertoeibacter niger TaxID=2656921 RepID=A0A8X8KPC9_9RHOB|nr:LysR family transcriptional regulator [Fertoeibacter niger]NUB45935.1 LysR family transcriptional regulator [Fertoeibacter niger]